MEIKAISVSTFNTYVSNIIEREEILSTIGVYGEICDLKLNKNIAFFTLKDEGANLSCVCFFENVFNNIKNGKQVTVIGSPQFYVKGGKLSFKVSKCIEDGVGQAASRLALLKEKLQKKGYFDENKKKPLKTYNQNIGVITSIKGAVIKDIINVTHRRNPSVNITVFNVGVQGDVASSEIANAIKIMDIRGFDCLIVGRGGGSSEDLNVFNSELIADAIYGAKTPIISAVGHQVDFTICDFCADLRAPTPSAAAELAIIDVCSQMQLFKKVLLNINKLCAEKIINYKQKYNYEIRNFLSMMTLKLSEAEGKFVNCTRKFNMAQQKIFELMQKQYEISKAKFEKFNPSVILKLGYAKVELGNSIASFKDIKIGDELKIVLRDGTLKSIVKEKIK